MSERQATIPTLSFELLADYVDGLLNPEAARRVEDRLHADEDSRMIVEGIRAFYAQHGRDREKLEAYLDDFARRLRGETTTRPRLNIWHWIWTVAIFAGFLLLVWWWRSTRETPAPPAERIVAQHLSAPPASVYILSRSDAPGEDTRFAIAQAYHNGNYPLAAQRIEALMRAGEALAADSLMLGWCYLFQSPSAPSAAARYLRGVADSGAPLYEQQARWYLALSLAAEGEWSSARDVLSAIVQRPGHFRVDEAAQLLEVAPEE